MANDGWPQPEAWYHEHRILTKYDHLADGFGIPKGTINAMKKDGTMESFAREANPDGRDLRELSNDEKKVFVARAQRLATNPFKYSSAPAEWTASAIKFVLGRMKSNVNRRIRERADRRTASGNSRDESPVPCHPAATAPLPVHLRINHEWNQRPGVLLLLQDIQNDNAQLMYENLRRCLAELGRPDPDRVPYAATVTNTGERARIRNGFTLELAIQTGLLATPSSEVFCEVELLVHDDDADDDPVVKRSESSPYRSPFPARAGILADLVEREDKAPPTKKLRTSRAVSNYTRRGKVQRPGHSMSLPEQVKSSPQTPGRRGHQSSPLIGATFDAGHDGRRPPITGGHGAPLFEDTDGPRGRGDIGKAVTGSAMARTTDTRRLVSTPVESVSGVLASPKRRRGDCDVSNRDKSPQTADWEEAIDASTPRVSDTEPLLSRSRRASSERVAKENTERGSMQGASEPKTPSPKQATALPSSSTHHISGSDVGPSTQSTRSTLRPRIRLDYAQLHRYGLSRS